MLHYNRPLSLSWFLNVDMTSSLHKFGDYKLTDKPAGIISHIRIICTGLYLDASTGVLVSKSQLFRDRLRLWITKWTFKHDKLSGVIHVVTYFVDFIHAWYNALWTFYTWSSSQQFSINQAPHVHLLLSVSYPISYLSKNKNFHFIKYSHISAISSHHNKMFLAASGVA